MQRFLRRGKDATLETAARIALNSRLSGIAEIKELSLDSGARCVRVTLQLCGESAPLELHVLRYRLREQKGSPEIAIDELTASRAWLQNVLERFVVGRWFEMPPAAHTALKLLT
ncbi:MAG: hypothetical protein ACJ8I9_01185 [Chthoniobacterales bacterium]